MGADLPIWTEEQYVEELINKDRPLCIQGYDREKLFETVDDFLESFPYMQVCPNFTFEDVISSYEMCKKVPVFLQDKFHISPSWLEDKIIDHSCNYGMDYWEREPEGMELIADFCKAFNEKQWFYTSGEQVAWVDLSNSVKGMFLEGLDDKETIWANWEKQYKERFGR